MLRIVLVIILLLVLLYVALHYSPVQTWLVNKVTNNLSKKLHAEVHVDKVDFSFFNKIIVEGVLVKDLQKDTLLSAGKLTGTVNDWFFTKDKINVNNVGLEDVLVNLKRTDSVWNYSFLVDYFSSPKTSTKKSGGDVDIDFYELHLKNIRFNKIDKWIGDDMIASIGKLDVQMKTVDLINKKIEFKTINFENPYFAQNDYTGNRPKRAKVKKTTPQKKNYQWNDDNWNVSLDNLTILNASYKNDKETNYKPYVNQFDGQHLYFTNVTGSIKNVTFIGDSLRANISLSGKEQSGLLIKKLESAFKFTPDIMEFDKLTLQVNNSILKDYYAMQYHSFNKDFSDFIHSVKLKGNFKNSVIHSNDLAIFAPSLKKLNRIINVSGQADGTVDDFLAKNLKLQSGSTLFDGNISLKGLPNIDSTLIDVQSNALVTNYNELANLIPQLKNLKKPSINKLGNIKYVGTFNGFTDNFKVDGKLNTSIGDLATTLNMNLTPNTTPTYIGNIKSKNFKLGTFLNTSQIGAIDMDLNVNGKGFDLKTLNEKVNGTISSIQVGKYNYQNLIIDGEFEKNLFKGHASIKDPNLEISSLDGSIDFTDKTPGFKLQTNIKNADLKALGFSNDYFNFRGDLDLNFTGNNIDNFLGNATIKNATLLQGNNKLGFDFLDLNSTIVGGKKSLSINTNEFDASIVGNFKILELPTAVQSLLSKYYPTYIKTPTRRINSIQNFTYDINTKNITDYLKLFDKNLNGFNNSHLNGSFDLQAYNISLNATLPQFKYDDKTFNNIVISANGNGDNLLTDISADEIYINDSLQLPFTKLNLNSSKDVSIIKLQTSASKIFGNAELNASVTTLSDGLKINFSPSSFIINNKKWQLEKDGELVLSSSVISASEVKFFSDDQSINLSTELSTENDEMYLNAKLKNIDIEDFAFVLPKDPALKGNITGNAKVYNILKKPRVEFDGEVANTQVNGEKLGKIELNGKVNTKTGLFDFNAKTNEADYKLNVHGQGNLLDSTGNAFSIKSKIDKLNLAILKPYLKSVFSNIQGEAFGDLEVEQRNGVMSLIGSPQIKSGNFTVGYTQVTYSFLNQNIIFGKNSINLNGLKIKDQFGNDGNVDGIIYHNFFNDFSFDNVRFSTNRMLLLNTTKKDNQQFYGNVIGQGKMWLNGNLANMKMNIEGEPSQSEKDNNHVYLPTGDSKENGAIDYIDFIQFGSKMDKDLSGKGQSNIVVNLKLKANPFCKIDVILDEATGDIVKGEGNGELEINVGTNDPLSIRGRYDITRGEYTYNFQKLLTRPFTVNSGSSISWSGDPMQAALDINAEYLVKKVDLSSLMSNSNTRLEEDLIIKSHFTGNLAKPEVNFDLKLPATSSSASNFYLLNALTKYKADENEMNKQVASLLLFGQLITQGNSFLNEGSLTTLAGGTVGNIVSSWLTGILNKQLEKATNGVVSLVIDVNPNVSSIQTAQLQANIRSSLQFRVRKNIKILVGSTFDVNNPLTALYGNKITPDFTIEWLINKDGTLRVTAYNRSTIDATNGQRNRSSIQFGFKRDVDRFGDIFRSKKRILFLDSLRLEKEKQLIRPPYIDSIIGG